MTIQDDGPRLRVGQAAEMLGVSVETLRRWETEGRLTMARSEGGQRLVDVEDVTRLLAERRRAAADRPIVAQSARNRFPGIVTRIERDRVAAVVEVLAGPHRVVSLMTAEAIDDMDLRVGDEAVCVVKATNVMVEVPSGGSFADGCPSMARAGGGRRVAGRLFRLLRRVDRRAIDGPRVGRRGVQRRSAFRHRGRRPRDLRRRLAESGPCKGQGQPTKRRTRARPLTVSTDSSSALETKIEQGAPADVFLSADTTNPQKLVDGGFASGDAIAVRGQQPHDHRADGQPGGDHVARRTLPSPASRSSPPATRCRSRSTPPSSSPTSPRSPAIRPTSPRPTRPTSRPRRTTSKAVVAKIELGEGDAGIVYVTDASLDKVAPVDVPDVGERPGDVRAASSSRPPRTRTPPRRSLTGSRVPDGPAILASFGFLAALVSR